MTLWHKPNVDCTLAAENAWLQFKQSRQIKNGVKTPPSTFFLYST